MSNNFFKHRTINPSFYGDKAPKCNAISPWWKYVPRHAYVWGHTWTTHLHIRDFFFFLEKHIREWLYALRVGIQIKISFYFPINADGVLWPMHVIDVMLVIDHYVKLILL